jgi:hypothetical protein
MVYGSFKAYLDGYIAVISGDFSKIFSDLAKTLRQKGKELV